MHIYMVSRKVRLRFLQREAHDITQISKVLSQILEVNVSLTQGKLPEDRKNAFVTPIF